MAFSPANRDAANNRSRYDFGIVRKLANPVSASKFRPPSARQKPKPYSLPTVKELTPDEAKAVLEAKGPPDDENVRKMLNAVRLRLGEKK